jgi:hypothetical protein
MSASTGATGDAMTMAAPAARRPRVARRAPTAYPCPTRSRARHVCARPGASAAGTGTRARRPRITRRGPRGTRLPDPSRRKRVFLRRRMLAPRESLIAVIGSRRGADGRNGVMRSPALPEHRSRLGARRVLAHHAPGQRPGPQRLQHGRRDQPVGRRLTHTPRRDGRAPRLGRHAHMARSCRPGRARRWRCPAPARARGTARYKTLTAIPIDEFIASL